MQTQTQQSLETYLEQLITLSVSDNGQIFTRSPVDSLLETGRYLTQHLSRALKSAGVALAVASDEDTGTRQWSLSSVGFLFSHVAEVIETIQAIESTLIKKTPGALWPIETAKDRNVSITKILWLLPVVSSIQAQRELKNSCECYMETETINIREYAHMLEIATCKNELGENTSSAVSLITEWTGFIIKIQQILVDLQVNNQLSAQAA